MATRKYDNENPNLTALNRYAALQTRPAPAGLAPGTNFDWFSAAPMSQTPAGLVQAPNTGQKGIAPGTLFGGLVDTRYSQGLEPQMAAGAAVRPIDTDLATGVPQYDREAQYGQLNNALTTVNNGLDATAGRTDKAALAANVRRQQAKDALTASLATFMQNQQTIPQGDALTGGNSALSTALDEANKTRGWLAKR